MEKNIDDLKKIFDVDVDDKDNIYVLARTFVSYRDDYSEANIQVSKLIKFDKNGNKIYEKNLNEGHFETFMERLKIYKEAIYVLGEVYDNLKYIGGSDESIVNKYGIDISNCLMKYDLDGNYIFDRTFGEIFIGTRNLFKIGEKPSATMSTLPYRSYDIKFKDDKIFLLGYFDDYSSQKRINSYAFININGDKIFDKKFDCDGYFRFASADLNDNGDFVVVGYTDGTKFENLEIDKNGKEGYVPVLLVIDEKGKINYSTYLKSLMQFKNVVSTYNGYFILADLKEKNIEGINNPKTNSYIIKFDKNLNIIAYDCVDFGYDLKKISNDKVMVTGQNWNSGEYGSLKVYEATFNIEIEINDYGKIEVNSESKSGEEVKIKVKPIDGYVLDSIEGVDIKKIDNETYSFIMPSQDIKLVPKFKKSIINPETKDIAIVGILSILVVAFVLICKNYKKIKWLN